MSDDVMLLDIAFLTASSDDDDCARAVLDVASKDLDLTDLFGRDSGFEADFDVDAFS